MPSPLDTLEVSPTQGTTAGKPKEEEEAQIRSDAGRDLPFTFFVSEASVVIGGEDPNEIQTPFLARKSERCMKDTVHVAVHRSVHLLGERTLSGALRLRFPRPLILDTGKTPEWAGATPLRCHGNRGGRSSPHVLREARLGARGNKHAANYAEELRASREVWMLCPRDLRQMRNRARCGSFHAVRQIRSVLLS